MLIEVQQYKNYIIILTEQIHILNEELERIVNEDIQLYEQVNQTERLNQFVNEQKQILNKEIEDINNFGNKIKNISSSKMQNSFSGF
jgi:uncharacterized coiled-coil protein SlyX